MAETKELRHAGIGIDLNVNGLDDFKRANSMMDDLLETMKEASRITDKFKSNFSGFGGKSSDEVRKTRDAVQDVYHSMGSTKNATNKVTENVHKMQQEFKHTSDAAKKIKLNSGLNSDINKSDEEVKKLAKSADQSGNKFNEMFRKLRSGSSKSNGSFSKLHDSAKKTFDEVHKGTHFLGDVVTASFISNAAINTWYSLKSGIGSALKAGEEYDKEQQVMHATWNTLTDSSVKGNRMVKAINSMSVSFGQSAGLVNELNQQFYHVLDKQGPTDRLTKSILTMADTLGMGAENTKRLGLNFTHMMASSKMQLGDFNMISDQLPMFGSKLLAYERKAMDNSHLTMSQLRKDMSAGKISAKDAENVMNSLGKKYAEASENMMKTLPGMERVMSARGAALFGALEKPFMKAKSPIFGAISKWVSDKKTEKEFTKVGTAASKGLNTITQSFAKVFNPKESPHLANDVMNSIAKGVTSVSNTIAHHAKSIVEFFKSLYYTVKILKDVGVGFAKGLVSGLSAIVTPIGKLAGNSKKIHSFSDALKSITTHKKGLEDIGKLLAGMFAAKKLLDMGSGIRGLRKHILEFTSSTRLMGAAIKLLPWALWIAGIAAAIAILVKLYQHDKKFRKFVNGIMASTRKMAKSFKNLWGDAKGIFKKGFKTIESIVNVGIDVLTGNWKGFKKDGVKLIKSFWSLAKDVFKADFDFINDLTGGKLEKMTKAFSNTWKDIGKGWKSFWNGISDWFGDLWKGIVKHVQDGINNVIKVLNSGISGIDSVIHAFGGSSKAIGKINPVHLATGTGALSGQRRAITKPTMAMLNDGHDSPETGNREMLIHPNGMGELIKGTNVKRMLEPGAEVLNATEVKMAMSMQHFASGTGFFSNLWKGTKKVAADAVGGVESGISGIGNFASKAWHGATHLLSTIQKIIAGPGKYLNSIMGKKPSGQGTILSDFAGGFYNSMKKQASTWWSSLWSMASGVLDDSGSASGLLAAVEKYGKGKKYVWGATGPNTFDCSGLVMYALKHAFGIDYPHFSGSQIAKAKSISKGDLKPGDLVGNNEHIGVYAGNGKYWSAMSPTSHPNIGMSSLSYFPGTPKFGRVPGTEDKSKNNTKSGGSALQKLIKQETGGMMGWIEKHLSPLLDSGGDASGGSVSSALIRKAASMMGVHPSGADIANIERVIQHESGGNAKAINKWDSNAKAGTPSKGILQFIDPTFQHYAMKGHKNIYSDLDQLLAMFNDTNWRSDVHTGGWGPTGAVRREKGGKLAKNQLSVVGEKGWELFNPDNSGVVIPHEASEKLISGGSKGKVTISAPTKVVIQGNADKSAIDELDSRLEKRNDDLIEKFRELWGLNDDGGLTV